MMAVKKASLLALLGGKPAPERASDAGAEAAEEEDQEEEDEEASSDASEGAAAEDGEEETSDSEETDGDEDEAEEDDEHEEEGDTASASSRRFEDAMSLLDHASAKGRTGLAKELAKDVAGGRMSLCRAEALLKAAPKAGSLSAEMKGKDKAPGVDAPKASASLSKSEEGLMATAKKIAGLRKKA